MEHNQTGYLNNDFRTCLFNLMNHGLKAEPRGLETREILNYNITLQDPRNRVITFKERNTNTKYLLGELIWYFGGSNDPAGILPYSKFWDQIRNSGNMPGYDKGTINSNYGHRLFGHDAKTQVPYIESHMTPYGVDESGKVTVVPHEVKVVHGKSQWQTVIDILKKDPDSRQAIMNIHIPSDRHDGNKDVACTIALQFFIRDNKFHMITGMRSNDSVLGFTNDVFQFTMLQEGLMLQLREAFPTLELGYYYHNAGSMHIYSRHFDMAAGIIANEKAVDVSMIPMDRFDEKIVEVLVDIEEGWRSSNCAEDYDFKDTPRWEELTPYWQTLVLAFFSKDEDAMHEIFGQDHE